MRLKWKLTIASLKIFVRQREAIIWTILLPIFMIVLFGLVDFDGIGLLKVGIVNDAGEWGNQVVERLNKIGTVDAATGTLEDEMKQLTDGDLDLLLVLPPNGDGTANVPFAYLNEAAPDEGELALIVVRSVLAQEDGGTGSETQPVLRQVIISGRNLGYIDFLIPGIISMSIMQMGIFGVAFSFVSLKKRGILRRLSVTPLRPADFIVGQIIMRLVVVLLQISLMVAVGILFLDLHFVGSLVEMFAVGILGGFVFLGMGFAIAGASSSEEQVAPAANIIAMPMILLSGVFFNRSGLPGIVHSFTDLLPLTYLADGLRAIAIDGAGLIDIVPDLTGLLVWCIISCGIAVYLFRWE